MVKKFVSKVHLMEAQLGNILEGRDENIEAKLKSLLTMFLKIVNKNKFLRIVLKNNSQLFLGTKFSLEIKYKKIFFLTYSLRRQCTLAYNEKNSNLFLYVQFFLKTL